MFLRSLADGITQPIISIYIRSLGLTITELGVLAAGLGTGLLIFEPIWGVLSDRELKKKIFILSSFFTSIITFLYTVFKGTGELFLLKFFNGVIMCAFGVSSRGLVIGYTPKRGRAFGLWFAIMGVAGLIGPTIGGYLAEIEYTLPFYVSATTSLGSLLGAILISDPKTRIERKSEGDDEKKVGGLKFLFGSRAFVVTSLIITLPMFAQGFLWNFLPVYVNESPRFLLNPLEIGFIFTVMSVVAIPTQLAFGEVSDKVGRNTLIIIGLIMNGLSFWLLPLVFNVNKLYIVVAIQSIGFSAVGPIMLALMVDSIPFFLQGTAIGFYGAFEDLGILLGPLVTGYIYQNHGSAISFQVCAVLLLFAAVCAYVLIRKK